MQEQIEDQIDLKAVYKVLTDSPWYQPRTKTLLLTKFANLIAEKSSFSHKVHKFFNNLSNLPIDNN